MASMKLSRLLYHLYDVALYSDIEITGLAIDSRKVKPGDLFFACKGTKLEGKHFIEEAVQRGAKAILEEVDSSLTPLRYYNNKIPILPVQHLKQYIGRIAATFYQHPTKKLKIIGITGTNGKTSCSYFIAQALQSLKTKCGIIGTLGSGMLGQITEGHLTTPDALTLHSLFAYFVKEKAKIVAMEVSSHSIDQGRINDIDFEIGVFTNLTRDHLDYHHTMEAYGETKKKLLVNPLTKYSVINADDEFGRTLLKQLNGNSKTAYAYTLNKDYFYKVGEKNVLYVDDIQLEPEGIRAKIFTPWGDGELVTPLVGQFNLSNVMATLATLCLLNIPFEQALKALQDLEPVPGRMQTFGGKGSKPMVVVDYAHTPDALEKVLTALRKHCKGRLLCLFGCGGDRDDGKRPLMAQIAEQLADYVVVTDDNPRTEDPQKIVNDILRGFIHQEKINIEHNRSKAIADIIQYATADDCVLIAGKGAETYQQIGNDKLPFSDIQKVMESLNARMAQ
jgi:UDP-N-acetylmuramoyl-L-alanyl-D-glutamate--2,6-diaminopimelate ligase